MWNLKYGTNELIYKTEIDSQKGEVLLTRGIVGDEGRGGLRVWG